MLLLCLYFPPFLLFFFISLSLSFTFSCIGALIAKNCWGRSLKARVGDLYYVRLCSCPRDTSAAESQNYASSDSPGPPCLVFPLCTLHKVSKFTVFLSAVINFLAFLFFPFTLLSYVTSICIFSERLHIVSSVQWGSSCGTHAFKHVCLTSCQGLIGKTTFACSSVSPRDTDYISMSSRPGRERSRPLRGRP